MRQSFAESDAIVRAGQIESLADIPPRDLARLQGQLTPFAQGLRQQAADRHEFTRIVQEWQMRGFDVRDLNTVYELLREDCKAQREANAAPRLRQLRQLYPEMYAPANPGLRVVRAAPTLTERLLALLRGQPDRPATGPGAIRPSRAP
jgi:hypothetical protein